jgi:hypothetical protein
MEALAGRFASADHNFVIITAHRLFLTFSSQEFVATPENWDHTGPVVDHIFPAENASATPAAGHPLLVTVSKKISISSDGTS